MTLPDWYCEECSCKWCKNLRWVPPTDDERKMFMDFAHDYMSIPSAEFDVKHKELYEWMCNDEPDETATKHYIAESLAMDGL